MRGYAKLQFQSKYMKPNFESFVGYEIGTELTKPRTVAISRFKSNSGVNTTDAENAEIYYRRNVYYPLIDHCMKEFSEHFPES